MALGLMFHPLEALVPLALSVIQHGEVIISKSLGRFHTDQFVKVVVNLL